MAVDTDTQAENCTLALCTAVALQGACLQLRAPMDIQLQRELYPSSCKRSVPSENFTVTTADVKFAAKTLPLQMQARIF